MSDPWTIAVAAPGQWHAALELALARVPAAERAARVLNGMALLAAGELCPEGVLIASDGAALVGVQVAVPLAGGSGLVWPPAVVPGYADSTLADRLAERGLAWLRARGARFAQALIDPAVAADAAPLARAGCRRVTQLFYLLHDLSEVPAAGFPDDLRLIGFTAENRSLFETTLLATYEGTLDCPEVNGLRTAQEVLEGHRVQGKWRPGNWLLAMQDGAPVGVLLLSELEGGVGWDLSYLGVVPAARGRGLGRLLTSFALRRAHAADALQLMVAVDARNLPALRVYESLGFERTQTRDVHLCLFRSSYETSAGEPL